MFDFIRGLFKKEFSLGNMSLISGHLSDIISLLEEEYMQDKSRKNEAIDAVIKILEEYKDKPAA
jgi:hypothetical protein